MLGSPRGTQGYGTLGWGARSGSKLQRACPCGILTALSRVWHCPLTGTLEEDRTELRGMCFVRSHASSGSFLVDAPHSPTEHLTRSLGGEEPEDGIPLRWHA